MPSRKRLWIGLVLTTAALLLIGSNLPWQSVPDEPAPAKSEPSPRVFPEETITRMETAATNTARQRLTQIPEPAIPETVGGFSREEVSAVVGGYREMLAVQGLYNQRAIRERLVDRILETSHGAEIASKTLSDPAFAREAFGELQAESRFFSIQVLKEAARRGDEELLLRTANSIAQELSRLEQGTTPLDKGRSADLFDLLIAFVSTKGAESFANEPQLAQKMGYSPSLSPEVKSIYGDALFFPLKRRFGRERATELTLSLLKG